MEEINRLVEEYYNLREEISRHEQQHKRDGAISLANMMIILSNTDRMAVIQQILSDHYNYDIFMKAGKVKKAKPKPKSKKGGKQKPKSKRGGASRQPDELLDIANDIAKKLSDFKEIRALYLSGHISEDAYEQLYGIATQTLEGLNILFGIISNEIIVDSIGHDNM